MQVYPIHWPEFYTASILNHEFLLHEDNYKDIIISSLRYLVKNNKIKLYAFVIMSNHIHLIWQAFPGNNPDKIRHSFKKYTAQQMKFELIKNNKLYLKEFKVVRKDRIYQFWKRDALAVTLFNEKVFFQKMIYIHYNPVKAGLCKNPEDYKYSSAGYYHNGEDLFGMLA
jgi:putative transposase